MKRGDRYKHYKGKEYEFYGIALPIVNNVVITTHLVHFADVSCCQNTMEVFACSDGAMFIDSDVPHVVYQDEKDVAFGTARAMRVDDFFGVVTTLTGSLDKRFTLIS